MAYGGTMRWRTKMGDEISASLGEPMIKDAIAQAWRTALDPKGEWIVSVLAAADKRLSEVRRGVPDAGGLVIASNQTQARAYAAHLRALTGAAPTVVLSDDSGASARIEEFATGSSRWMVAVRMVSEGVDVPRLCVGVYATSTSTPLYFAQAIGRFVRARRRGETASVFLPSVTVVLDHAARLEEQRDHALDRKPNPDDVAQMWAAEEQSLLDEANREAKAVGPDEGSFEALESDAHFDHVLFDKQQWGMHAQVGSEAEQEYLGLPGLLEPTRSPSCCRSGRPSRSRSRLPRPGLRTHPWRRTARSRRSARSSTGSCRPMPGRRASHTPTCTRICVGRAAAPTWPRRRPSRSARGSRRSGSGSSAAAEAISGWSGSPMAGKRTARSHHGQSRLWNHRGRRHALRVLA